MSNAGQQTTSPGGFASALPTVSLVLEHVELVRKHAKPDAGMIDLTNPAGIHRRAARARPPPSPALQRGDRVQTALREGVPGRTRRRPARPHRAEPPDVGARHAGDRYRRHNAGRARGPALRRSPRPHRRHCAHAPVPAPAAGSDPLVLPCGTSPVMTSRCRNSSASPPGPRSSRRPSGRCSRSTPTSPSRRSSPNSSSTAGRTTPRPRSNRLSSILGDRGDVQVLTAQNDDPFPSCPTTTSSRSPPASPG
ncbi:hypothetical protein KK106_05475 [Curtobacterium flaccumfaciens pv. flaccumfaciens]|nr:hypothetical protein [Curtobacterium flaccumfaciens pv. flaccumfaciens]